jgi:hypothetical protein
MAWGLKFVNFRNSEEVKGMRCAALNCAMPCPALPCPALPFLQGCNSILARKPEMPEMPEMPEIASSQNLFNQTIKIL